MYLNIFSQLYYDGYTQIAMNLAQEVHADPPCPPSERLLHVVNAGLQHEPDRHKNRDPTPGLNPIQEILIGPGLGESKKVIPLLVNKVMYRNTF
jgi:cleavage stimulation factor subunit 1